MVNVPELKAAFVRNGLSQKAVAEAIGLTERTMSTRLKKGVFTTDEMAMMCQLLQLSDPMAIFLARE